jgi:hypothetical protein
MWLISLSSSVTELQNDLVVALCNEKSSEISGYERNSVIVSLMYM